MQWQFDKKGKYRCHKYLISEVKCVLGSFGWLETNNSSPVSRKGIEGISPWPRPCLRVITGEGHCNQRIKTNTKANTKATMMLLVSAANLNIFTQPTANGELRQRFIFSSKIFTEHSSCHSNAWGKTATKRSNASFAAGTGKTRGRCHRCTSLDNNIIFVLLSSSSSTSVPFFLQKTQLDNLQIIFSSSSCVPLCCLQSILYYNMNTLYLLLNFSEFTVSQGQTQLNHMFQKLAWTLVELLIVENVVF